MGEGEVLTFSGITKQPLPVERILTSDSALALSEVVVIGWTDEGKLHIAMSDPDISRAVLLLAVAQQTLVKDAEE